MFNKNTTVFQNKQVWPLQGYKRRFMFLSCSKHKFLIIEVSEFIYFSVSFNAISVHQMALRMKSNAFQKPHAAKKGVVGCLLNSCLLQICILEQVHLISRIQHFAQSESGFGLTPHKNVQNHKIQLPICKRKKKTLVHFALSEIKKY